MEVKFVVLVKVTFHLACASVRVRVCERACFQPLCFLLKIYESYFLCHLSIRCIILKKVLSMCNTSSTQQQIYFNHLLWFGLVLFSSFFQILKMFQNVHVKGGKEKRNQYILFKMK